MSKPITQAEAHRLRKRVAQLEMSRSECLNAWGKEWPDGTYFMSIKDANVILRAKIEMSRALKCAVVCTIGNGEIHFHAIPIPDEIKS